MNGRVRTTRLALPRSNDVTKQIADPDWVAFCLELTSRVTSVPPRRAIKDDDDKDDEDYIPTDEDEVKYVPAPPSVKRPRLLPFATTIAEYFQPEGTLQFRPRPEWWPQHKEYNRSLFKHQDTILHAAIRENATEAALAVIELERTSLEKDAKQRTNDDKAAATKEKRHINDNAAAAPRSKVRWATRPMFLFDLHLLESVNEKGVTPLILAAQKGNLPVVQALLRPPHAVDPTTGASDGTTAVLQAAHFGHVDVLEMLLLQSDGLIEAANGNGTTPLMRAAQEGHLPAVECLLQYGAAVNRENRVQMTPLLLAAQRGHAMTCARLLRAGARHDHKTAQQQSALNLACQRGHVAVVKVLLTAGCELYALDREGRTVQAMLERSFRSRAPPRLAAVAGVVRGQRMNVIEEPESSLSNETRQELYQLIDPIVQVELMQQAARVERNREFMRIYMLLQQHRAHVRVPNLYAGEDAMIDLADVVDLYNRPPPPVLSLKMVEPPPSSHLPLPQYLTNPSTEALMRTMALPPPLVQMIVLFLPAPKLWTKRIAMLQATAFINANEGIMNTIDFLDEILEEGGFLTACDLAQVPAPLPHVSWVDWKRSASSHPAPRPIRSSPRGRIILTEATPLPPQDPAHPTIYELRRQVGYLPLLAQYQSQSNLPALLTAPPYRMPPHLLQQLLRTADIASIVRRCEGQSSINFEAHGVMDVILLASRLCSWYWRERLDEGPMRSGA
jgi:ankyrin repeat protein